MADKSITEDSKDFSSYQRKTGWQAFATKVNSFVWDKYSGKFLTRTKQSWGKNNI